jgi:hypothetical protein
LIVKQKINAYFTKPEEYIEEELKSDDTEHETDHEVSSYDSKSEENFSSDEEETTSTRKSQRVK